MPNISNGYGSRCHCRQQHSRDHTQLTLRWISMPLPPSLFCHKYVYMTACSALSLRTIQTNVPEEKSSRSMLDFSYLAWTRLQTGGFGYTSSIALAVHSKIRHQDESYMWLNSSCPLPVHPKRNGQLAWRLSVLMMIVVTCWSYSCCHVPKDVQNYSSSTVNSRYTVQFYSDHSRYTD